MISRRGEVKKFLSSQDNDVSCPIPSAFSLCIVYVSVSSLLETETCTYQALLWDTVQYLHHNRVVNSSHMLDWGWKEERDNLAWNTTVFLAIRTSKNPHPPWALMKRFSHSSKQTTTTIQSYSVVLLPKCCFQTSPRYYYMQAMKLLCMTKYRTPQVTERCARKHASGQNPLKSTSWSLQLYSMVFIRNSLKSILHNGKLHLYSLKAETPPSSLTPPPLAGVTGIGR